MNRLKKTFLLLGNLIFFLFIFQTPIFAKCDNTTDIPDNPLDIDPTCYCSVVVNQIRDGEVLNKYDKTHVFRVFATDANGNRARDAIDMKFTFDLRQIPDKYWTIFVDNNNNGLLDQLEKSRINFDVDALLSDERCIIYTNDVNPSVNPESVLNYTTDAYSECYIDNLDGSKEFKVALRYNVGRMQYKSICEQTITVDKKTFDEVGTDAVIPEAIILYDTDDKNHNVNSTWEITIKDVKIPESLLGLLSLIDIRISSAQLDDTSNPFELASSSWTISNYVVEQENLSGYSLPGSGVRSFMEDSRVDPYIHFKIKFDQPGDYYLSLFVNKDLTHFVKIEDLFLRVNPEGVSPPPPTSAPMPTIPPELCEAEVKKQGGLNAELCKGVCIGIPECDQFKTYELKKICETVRNVDGTDKNENEDCKDCLEKGNAYTVFGCLPTSIEGFFQTVVFQLGLGLAGGIAFLLMLWGSFTILISQGDPQQIQRGREIIVSAIAGLLLIIFSMVIMQFLGYNVLRIPGFGAGNPDVGTGSSTVPPGDPAFNQTFTPPTPTPTKIIPAVNPNLSVTLINPSSPDAIPKNSQINFTVEGPNVPLALEYSVLTSAEDPYLCFPVDWKLNIGETRDKGGVTIHTPRLNLPDGSYKIAIFTSTSDNQSTCTHGPDSTPITTYNFSIQDIAAGGQCEIKTVQSGGCYVENVCAPRPNCEPVVTNNDGSMDIKCCY